MDVKVGVNTKDEAKKPQPKKPATTPPVLPIKGNVTVQKRSGAVAADSDYTDQSKNLSFKKSLLEQRAIFVF